VAQKDINALVRHFDSCVFFATKARAFVLLSKAKQPCVLKRSKALNLKRKHQLKTYTNIKSLATKAQAFVLLSKAKQLCVLKRYKALNLKRKHQLKKRTTMLNHNA
jgi:hypothetical protein